MKLDVRFLLTVLVASVSVFVGVLSVFPQGVPDSRCSVDFGMIPDMADCQRYLVCRYGIVQKYYSCYDGQLYDEENRLCDYSEKVQCGQRLTAANVSTGCYVSRVNVTIQIENKIQEPPFRYDVDLHVPRLPLAYLLLMAAGRERNFTYKTTMIPPYGEFLTSINDVKGDYANRTLWMIWSGGFPIEPPDLQAIYPADGDKILLRFQQYIGRA